jgi:polysaccharide biosynthesis/export protein
MGRTILTSSHCAGRITSLPLLASLAGMTLLGACSSGPPLTSHAVPASESAAIGMASPVVSTESQTIPSDADQEGLAPYHLGPGDIISISVYRHPELSIPQAGGGGGGGGVMITNDGSVDLTLIGNVTLGGLTVAQAHDRLNADYSKYVQMVDVAVQLVSPRSLRYYLLGDFAQPGVKFPERELTLLDALSLGGSIDISDADLFQAYVTMGSQKLPVDVRALLVDGDMSQNIMLGSGATIVIPPAADEKAFVFGSVGKPGAIGFEGGSLSLLQALSEAGMDLTSYSAAKLSQVRVIRSHGADADFIIVDAAKILQGEAAPFSLEPGDVVFVAPTTVASWNQALDMLLPSLQTISGVLNPFVSIKFLSQRNN